MAPKHHPTPLSGGDRKAQQKELGKARAMTNILAAQSAEMRAKAETMLQQADRLLCEVMERADVVRWRADRSVADHRPGDQRRFSVAGDPMLPLQDAERRRPRRHEAPADHLRARSRQPSALPQMRQGRTAPVCDLAAAFLATPPPPDRGLGCGHSRNYRPSILPTAGRLLCEIDGVFIK